MARHRVGDSYLSDEEYETHVSESWAGGLFFVGIIVAGVTCYILTMNEEWPKFIRFGLIVVSAVGTGFLLARFSEAIRIIVCIAIALGIIAIVGNLIWAAL